MTILLFVEPPADPKADFPTLLDRKGNPTKNDPLRKVMDFAREMSERHVHQDVEVVTAFLCDDANQVRSLMERNEWPFRAAMVPGGLANPLVRQLGILSADRIPNVYLLRRDGTVAWHTSGFAYKSDFGYPFAIRLAIKVHIEVCDTELAYRHLAKKEFEKAKSVFSGPFLPEKDERYRWRAPRFHGRALANMGLKHWPAALEDIETAISAHKKEFDHTEENPCATVLRLRRVKAAILEKMGRSEEAKAERSGTEVPDSEEPTNLYEEFHRKLEELGKN